MNKRIIFGHQAHVRKIFTALFSTKNKIIFSLYDLRGLCGEKIAFLQGSQLIQKFRLIPITILKAIFCTQIYMGASNMVFEDLFGIRRQDVA